MTFHCGVDSPVKIASFTMALPANNSMSAGTDLSSPVEERPMETTSPGTSSVPGSFTHLRKKRVIKNMLFLFIAKKRITNSKEQTQTSHIDALTKSGYQLLHA